MFALGMGACVYTSYNMIRVCILSYTTVSIMSHRPLHRASRRHLKRRAEVTKWPWNRSGLHQYTLPLRISSCKGTSYDVYVNICADVCLLQFCRVVWKCNLELLWMISPYLACLLATPSDTLQAMTSCLCVQHLRTFENL